MSFTLGEDVLNIIERHNTTPRICFFLSIFAGRIEVVLHSFDLGIKHFPYTPPAKRKQHPIMNKKLTFIIVALIVFVLTGCGKDEKSSSGNDTYTVPEQNLVEITRIDTFDPKEMPEAISTSNLAKFYIEDEEGRQMFNTAFNTILHNRLYILDTLFSGRKIPIGYRRDWSVKSLIFTYRSLSAAGKPIVLSGRVSFPQSNTDAPHEVQSLSLFTHFLLHTTNQAPSEEISPLVMRTLYNSAVIEPDFEGYGVTKGQPFPGFSFAVQARQMADCIRAALAAMQQHGITLAPDGYSTAWGGSLATPGVMAFVRHYDQELTQKERDNIRLKSAFMGCGPMLLRDMVEYFDAHPEYGASGLCYLTGFLAPLPKADFGGYALQDFLPKWIHTHQLTIDGETMTYYEAHLRNLLMLSDHPDDIDISLLKNNLAEDMCTANGHLDLSNPKTQLLLNLIQRLSNWGGWQPQEDVYLTHSRSDRVIPYPQAETFSNKFKDCEKFHFKPIHTRILDDVVASHTSSTLICLILSVLHEDPAMAYRMVP